MKQIKHAAMDVTDATFAEPMGDRFNIYSGISEMSNFLVTSLTIFERSLIKFDISQFEFVISLHALEMSLNR